MAARIGIIVNRNVRTRRTGALGRGPLQPVVGPWCRVEQTFAIGEIPTALSRLLDERIEVLAILGGDGTQHAVLTELVHLVGEQGPFPSIVVLRGGTMNMVANNLGTRLGVAQELRLLRPLARRLEDHFPVRRIPARLLRVQDAVSVRSRYGFVLANGVAYRILKTYYRSGRPSVAHAFNTTTSLLAGSFLRRDVAQRYFARIPARVTMDDRPLPQDSLKVSVAATIPNLVLWFCPFPGNGRPATDGFYFLFNAMRTAQIARNVLALSRGQYVGPGQVSGIVRRVTYECEGGYGMDGEVVDLPARNRLVVSRGPKLLFVDLGSVATPRTTLHPSFRVAA